MSDEARLHERVRERYGAVARAATSCCPPSTCCGESPGIGANLIGDAYRGVEGHVPEADLALGCGVPTRHAGIRDGDTVLDLGSGAGNDVFVARRIVGPSGHVIGVDMTPEMIARARANAAKLGYANVEFREGQIEALPVADASVDVVISNCVLNLVPDKRRAFGEILRVLRPGGRFCIADIVATGELPPEIAEVAALYVGCIAGALPEARYLAIVREAGFSDVAVAERKAVVLDEAMLAPHLPPEVSARFRSSGVGLASVTVVATRPHAA